MVEPLHLNDFTWALTTLLELILLVYLFRRQLYRSHPLFSTYLLATVLESGAVALSYRYWGAQSMQYFDVASSSQMAVVCARWLAVGEVARKVLRDYLGIWGIARRILFVLGAITLTYAVSLSKRHSDLAVLNADLAVELCLGAFIVCMFLFARYYRLTVRDLERRLAVGFCLFSCTWVINHSVFENWRKELGLWWEFLSVLSFLVSLVVWISALRRPVEAQEVVSPAPLAPEMYGNLSQQLNSRLHTLNNLLNQLLRSEDSRPWTYP